MSTNNEEVRELLAQKLSEKMGKYTLKGPEFRRRTAARGCLLSFGSLETLADKLELFDQLYGRAEGVQDFDQLSRLGFGVGTQKARSNDLETYDWVFKKIFGYNAPIILAGGQLGNGKTDVSLLAVENGIKYNEVEKFAGNIESVDPQTVEDAVNHEVDYSYLSNWDELTEWIESDRKPKAFIHDEATQNLDKRRGMNQLVIEYTHKAELMRKHNAKVILIAPDPYELDKRLTTGKLTNAIMEKQSKKTLQLEAIANIPLRKTLPQNPISYKNVPPTEIAFDTHEVATFKVTEGGGSKGLNDKDKARLILYDELQREGTSQRGLAKKYDIGRGKIQYAKKRAEEILGEKEDPQEFLQKTILGGLEDGS